MADIERRAWPDGCLIVLVLSLAVAYLGAMRLKSLALKDHLWNKLVLYKVMPCMLVQGKSGILPRTLKNNVHL